MIHDTAFDEAGNVGDIQYRLHPLDVGFDLRGEKMPIRVALDEPTLRVSYADRAGDRRVMYGSTGEVVAKLRKLGYKVLTEAEA